MLCAHYNTVVINLCWLPHILVSSCRPHATVLACSISSSSIVTCTLWTKQISHKPCGMSRADVLASPMVLKARHEYSNCVSTISMFFTVSRDVSCFCSRRYLSESRTTVPATDHSTVGSGRPLTLTSKVTSVFKVVVRSVSGCVKAGAPNITVISALDSMVPKSLVTRRVKVAESSTVDSSMVKMISSSSVMTCLK